MDPDIDKLRRDSLLDLAVAPITVSQNTVPYDVSQDRPTPVVRAAHRYTTFTALHILTRPGVAASVRPVTQSFVYFNVKRDVRQWSSARLRCQRLKVH